MTRATAMASNTPSNSNASCDLWAITSYFNPAGFRRRLTNYRIFRQRLNVPLVTVELSFGPEFELSTDDADILIQLRGGDVMWQKERLLNVALQALPNSCEKVAWLDCDILFGNPAWPENASKALDQFAVVQLFERAFHMRRDVELDPLGPERADAEGERTSLCHAISSGSTAADCLDNRLLGRKPLNAPGFAWATSRRTLDQHHFYDACIIGAGDRALACAFLGYHEHIFRIAAMNDRQQSHYREWAEPLRDIARDGAGVVGGDLFHLWHGAVEDRRYETRFADKVRYEFDPFEDIAVGRTELGGGPAKNRSCMPTSKHTSAREEKMGRSAD